MTRKSKKYRQAAIIVPISKANNGYVNWTKRIYNRCRSVNSLLQRFFSMGLSKYLAPTRNTGPMRTSRYDKCPTADTANSLRISANNKHSNTANIMSAVRERFMIQFICSNNAGGHLHKSAMNGSA
mmetsp:Transcript_19691/g.27051  ORF Transcript_19691/g.27051 Transcript_19691/m.27051 type:complete len:126 (+) Transcript_19691:426-803(+)